MTRVSSDNFVQSLNHRGGYIDIRRMSPGLEKGLSQAGISKEDLQKVAGQDHIIRGNKEFALLFRLLDKRDDDGSSRTIRTHGKAGDTACGRLFSKLKEQADANRALTARRGGKRFANNPDLDLVYRGKRMLKRGSTGEGVRRVQQALIDMGYGNAKTIKMGTYDRETVRAVRRFQRDAELGIDGKIGSRTLHALAASAPPPGQVLERKADYKKLFQDGRLDVTLAVGFDEPEKRRGVKIRDGAHLRQTREVINGLRKRGFSYVSHDEIQKMTQEKRERLGLTGDRYDPNAKYFIKDDGKGGKTDSVVRLITPKMGGATARAAYKKAMQHDEVVIYSGHARYGTGPDFDHKYKGKGNFVIDGHGNRHADRAPAGLRRSIGSNSKRSDLRNLTQRPDYQLLIFGACSTEEYLKNLRNPNVFKRDQRNTDIIATTLPTMVGTGSDHMLRFLDGVSRGESNNTMLRDQNQIEMDYLRRIGDTKDIPKAAMTYTESGFLGNTDTRSRRPEEIKRDEQATTMKKVGNLEGKTDGKRPNWFMRMLESIAEFFVEAFTNKNYITSAERDGELGRQIAEKHPRKLAAIFAEPGGEKALRDHLLKQRPKGTTETEWNRTVKDVLEGMKRALAVK